MARQRRQVRDEVEYREEHKLQCVTCGGRFTRIFMKAPCDEAEAKARQHSLEREQQCPFCSRFRPLVQEVSA